MKKRDGEGYKASESVATRVLQRAEDVHAVVHGDDFTSLAHEVALNRIAILLGELYVTKVRAILGRRREHTH